MTVTLPSGQLTVILAVGLTCWPYLSSAVCLVVSGTEDLICVCKMDQWPSGKGEQRSQFMCCIFLLCNCKYAERSPGIWGGGGVYAELSPVGLKESYLLLLPITSQSPALSTCKMTLDMPVLTVFYRWSLHVLVIRPTGAQGPHSLTLRN